MICTGELTLTCLIGRHDWIGARNELVEYLGPFTAGGPEPERKVTVIDQGQWCRHCGKVNRHGTMTGPVDATVTKAT